MRIRKFAEVSRLAFAVLPVCALLTMRPAFSPRARAATTASVQAPSSAGGEDALLTLAEAFWAWRATEQPFTNDDIPRIERPEGYRVDWSSATIAQREHDIEVFEKRWKSLPPGNSVHAQVDSRLLGSALARVRWELTVEQSWKRNPNFYIDQTLGSVYALLLPPPPFEEARQKAIVARMESIPATLADARRNLTDMRQPFARLAVAALENVSERLTTVQAALAPQLSPDRRAALAAAIEAAARALEQYRDWLSGQVATLPRETAIGRENYLFFLRQVALVPYTPEQMLERSAQEWSRAVSFEAYEQARNAGLPALPLFADQQAQIAREAGDEIKVRKFLVERGILSVPGWLQHYRNLPLPAYLEPFEELGVTDDLTSATRLKEDGTSYIRKPSMSLGYFNLSTARDPRPILVHEGVPGHYFQLALSWANPDPIRRHYYDSGANEGIGFYAEEMMLQAGFFDDSPRTREILYSFMRLRALRVEVDVKLALGEFTLEQAAEYLAQAVPMDKRTALDEAAMFASTPGQAITYQVGKIQIMDLLAAARRKQGTAFRLQAFHDSVWTNGNVPIALQKWEMLEDGSDVPPLAKAH